MLIESKSGRKFIIPTQEEDAAINAGIAADADTYAISNAEFSQLKRIGRPRATTPSRCRPPSASMLTC